MKNKNIIIGGAAVFSLLMVYTVMKTDWTKQSSNTARSLSNANEDILLAIVKNDEQAFQKFVDGNGDIHSSLPLIDGRSMTVAEALVYYERTEFLGYLKEKNVKLYKEDRSKDYDIMTLAIEKNNPEILKLVINENPSTEKAYGEKGWNLQHLASAKCSDKVMNVLEEAGQLSWDKKATDGSTAMTLAAEKGCLPILGKMKEKSVDFRAKDGRGITALELLKKRNDPAMSAFTQSVETPSALENQGRGSEASRKPASVDSGNDLAKIAGMPPVRFYNKNKKFPKAKLVDYSKYVEPGDRPENANETADHAEFSD